jgi:hypothetical protein
VSAVAPRKMRVFLPKILEDGTQELWKPLNVEPYCKLL